MPAPNAASDRSACLSPKPSQPLPLRWGICETHQCVFITGWTPTKAARRHGHPSGVGAVPSPQAGQPWQRPAGRPAWLSGTSQQLTGQQGARAGPARPPQSPPRRPSCCSPRRTCSGQGCPRTPARRCSPRPPRGPKAAAGSWPGRASPPPQPRADRGQGRSSPRARGRLSRADGGTAGDTRSPRSGPATARELTRSDHPPRGHASPGQDEADGGGPENRCGTRLTPRPAGTSRAAPGPSSPQTATPGIAPQGPSYHRQLPGLNRPTSADPPPGSDPSQLRTEPRPPRPAGLVRGRGWRGLRRGGIDW